LQEGAPERCFIRNPVKGNVADFLLSAVHLTDAANKMSFARAPWCVYEESVSWRLHLEI